MRSEALPPSPADPAKGLPPVVPPSGKFIAQLFLVPGLIVTGAVLLLIALGWLVGGATPERFLQRLDSSNPEERWRGAEDLAQVLLRDERLAADPRFALDLADRLQRALDAIAPAEEAYAERMRSQPAEEADPERKKLEADRNYIHYLMACLSEFTVPAGMPLLKDLAEKPDAAAAADALGQRRPEARWASRRPEAVWALGKLGNNLQRFDKLPEDQRQAVLAALKTEADGSDPGRARCAEAARLLLEGRQNGKPQLLGLDEVFAKCAATDDPFLRSMTALALNFWEGDPAENARLDEILSTLAQAPDSAEDRTPVLEVRYNAAVALARRGSDRARLDLLAEMLDAERQRQNFRLKGKDGADRADEVTAQTTVVNALRAVTELHRRRPDRDLSELRPALERLARGDDVALRTEAEHTLQSLANP
jgi:hypothetical protein